MPKENLQNKSGSISQLTFVSLDSTLRIMGYPGRLAEKLKAQQLRKLGWSYREILQKISISKDTLSRWCKDIPLTEAQNLRLLNNKKLGQRRGSIVAAENKRRARVLRTEQIQKEALRFIGGLSQRDKLIMGIALYAAEGDKADGRGGFANSDPLIIKFMMNWFLKFAQVPLSRLRGAIWIHEGLDEFKARKFWSKLTGIPVSQFHKSYISKNKVDSKKIRKNIHQYGVFSIRFSDSDKQRRIIGWISAVLSGKIPLVHLQSSIAQR